MGISGLGAIFGLYLVRHLMQTNDQLQMGRAGSTWSAVASSGGPWQRRRRGRLGRT